MTRPKQRPRSGLHVPSFVCSPFQGGPCGGRAFSLGWLCVLSVERQTAAYGGVVNVEVFLEITGLGLFSFHIWDLVNN